MKPNKTRSLLIAAIFLVSLLALGVFYFATVTVIDQAFTKIEDKNINQNTLRVTDALSNRIDQLKFKATDWASWDDTYDFVINRNSAYIKSNLQSGSLNNLGIHYMLFFNAQQKLVYAKAVSPLTGEDAQTPQALLDNFKPGSKLLASTEDSSSKGLLKLPGNETVKFVGLPILTSDSTGPIHGTLVFAATITKDEVALLSSLTHLTAGIYRLDDPARPADVKTAIGDATSPKGAILKPSEQTVVGYQTVNDVYDHPIIVARVEKSRDIHQTATGAIREFLVIIISATFISIAIVLLLMRQVRSRDHTIALKNEFFSIASHELRTPLTVIRNYAQLMKFQFANTIKDPKFDHMADSIDQAGAQLIGVVNVYLDAARLESGKIPFQAQAFSMVTLTSSLEAQLKATAQTKNLTVTIDCPADLPPVLADQERVRQVFLNLFGNAMKFTESGGITIKAELTTDNKVWAYVTDTGRGMDEATSHQLFQRFKQTEAKDALRGSGLGLFISKKLIEQMGGEIRVVSSAPGIGTSIAFSLPLAPATQPVSPATPPASTTPPAPSDPTAPTP